MFKCKKCNRCTHYACTNLPEYQVSLFLTKYYSTYICEDCVGVIDPDLISKCKPQPTAHKELLSKLDILEGEKKRLLDENVKI